MIALRIILEEQLPVGAHVVFDGSCDSQIGEIEPRKPAQQALVGGGKRLWILSQVDEQEPLPALDRNLVQRVIAFGESLDIARGGCPDQPAIKCIGPSMVGTLDSLGKPAGGLLTQSGAPVATDVIVRPIPTSSVPEHDDALGSD